jgi:hypothetical protein
MYNSHRSCFIRVRVAASTFPLAVVAILKCMRVPLLDGATWQRIPQRMSGSHCQIVMRTDRGSLLFAILAGSPVGVGSAVGFYKWCQPSQLCWEVEL